MIQKLGERGLSGRFVPVSRLDDLRKGIEGHRNAGMLDDELYHAYLEGFEYKLPESLPNARSIVVVASRQPGYRFTFNKNGKQAAVIVPPTYLHGARSDGQVRKTLEETLAPYKVVPAVLPKKLLAVRSGLATYGRNNVTYVPGMGSYHRITAFYTDMPCPEGGEWREQAMMESCKDCSICMDNCPSGAITNERFLLHAERCIVFHNEKPSTVPFPAWMDESWHNCLVGCLRCQEFCPENKGMLDFVNGAEFSSGETEMLLAGKPQDKLPALLLKKLEDWDLLSSRDVLSRNLAAIL